MANPKFSNGQRVQYMPTTFEGPDSAREYLVVRMMPDEGHGLSYRLKSPTNGQERTAQEHQLELVAGA